MKTDVFSSSAQKDNGARFAGKLISTGQLVAFPTETVYGLGANGLDGEAVSHIFEVKGRPCDNPLILHVARKSDASRLYKTVTPLMHRLMDAFWPGPLTIVYYKSDIVPDEVTAGLDTVAVRMPENKTALSIIREAGVPVAAPSANLSGKPSPTEAKHVLEDFNGLIPLVIDGGPCRVGVESTVLSLVGAPTILRPGFITREMLECIIGDVRVSDAVMSPLKDGAKASSPGMKYKHYAPNAEVVVVTGGVTDAAKRIVYEYEQKELMGRSCAILATKQTESFYRGKKYVIMGDRQNEATLLANLFSSLRQIDSYTDLVFAEALPPSGLGLAFMNRLLRAAGFCTINATDIDD